MNIITFFCFSQNPFSLLIFLSCRFLSNKVFLDQSQSRRCNFFFFHYSLFIFFLFHCLFITACTILRITNFSFYKENNTVFFFFLQIGFLFYIFTKKNSSSKIKMIKFFNFVCGSVS